VQTWILSVRPAPESGLPSVDVCVRARADSTVADLARALGRHLAPAVHDLSLVPTDGGQPWPADRRLSECGLRTGDLVDVVQAPTAWRTRPGGPTRSRAVLRVVDGPDRGRRVRVGAAQATIGRAPGCTLQLSDPLVSQRHARIDLGPRPVVHDEGSANGTTVAQVPVAATAVDWGTTVRLGATTVAVERGDVVEADQPVSVFRPPRFGDPLRDEVLEAPAPPTKHRPTPLPWAMLLLPMVMGLAIMLRSPGPYALVYMLAWPVVGGLGYWQQRRAAERNFAEELRDWRVDLDALLSELDDHAVAQRERTLDDYPDVETLRVRAASRDRYLWARAEDRDAFLSTRLGLGTVPALLRGEVRDGGDRAARRGAAAELAERDALEDLPVLADLAAHPVVAVTGPEPAVDALVRALLLRLGFDHSPAELSVAAALGHDRAHHEAWLRWLPHVAAREGGEPAVAVGARDATALLEHLASEGATRGHTVCVVDEASGIPRRTVEAVAAGALERGLHLLWLGRRAEEVPAATGLLVDLDTGRVGVRDRGGLAGLALADAVSLDHAWRHARSVTAYVDEAAVLPPSTAIPQVVRLTEVSSDLEDLDDADAVRRRWAQSAGLRAQIGRGADGTVTIDLRDDGPHGLVAGTTGSGKSELLQSLICSLALNNPPERITFLLVDYKGGAAFRECADLPHTVGYITDLTPALVSRALTSLGAEITAREELLARYAVKDLVQLEREHPEAAPPSLLICVDEFAALTQEVPDFVDGMVNLAQRGRSLGMHLLLATQRPAGVVTGPIRANTDLRIALRVSSADDSRDVIDLPEAAHISRRTPGRAWVRRTGHGTAELVQSAWTGARAPLAEAEAAVEVTPFTATAGDGTADRAEGRLDPRSDLERCVRSIQTAFVMSEAAAPHRPWLPALPSELLLDAELVAGAGLGAGRVVLGRIDDPAAQAQPPWVADLASTGHLLVQGASGSGKTELLRTVALSASLGDAAAGVAPYVYGIDCAGGGLTAVAGLPTVAAVVPETQQGRVLRLLRLLRRTALDRAGALASHGCSDVDDLARNGLRLPRVYLLVDNLPALLEMLEGGGAVTREHLDHLTQVLQNGRRVGVHVVATAPGRTGIPTSTASAFGSRVVLRMTSKDDYLMLGVPSGALDADSAPGAGLVGTRRVQVMTTGGVGTPVQAERVRGIGERLLAHVESRPGAPVPPMPGRVDPDLLPAPETGGGRAHVALAVDADAVAPVAPDLLAGPVLVAGRPRSGRSSALAGLVSVAARATVPPHVVHRSAVQDTLADLRRWLDETPEGSGSWALVVVDGADLWDARAVTDLGVKDTVAQLISSLHEHSARVSFVASADLTAARQRPGMGASADGLLAFAKGSRRGLLLQPEWNDGDAFGLTVPTRTVEPMSGVGRGLWCEAGEARVVQALCAPQGEPTGVGA